MPGQSPDIGTATVQQPVGPQSEYSHFLPIIVIGIIVVIVAGGLSFLLLNHPNVVNNSSVPITSTAVSSTINGQNSSQQGTTTIPSSSSGGLFTDAGGGPGQYYMSETEMAGLIGSPNGNYISLHQPNPTNETGVYKNNVTAYWYAGYTVYSSSSTRLVSEFVTESPSAPYLYAAQLQAFLGVTGKVLATNATSNGFTYSAVEHQSSNSSSVLVFGYKGNYTVSVAAPQGTNQTRIASLVASDIP